MIRRLPIIFLAILLLVTMYLPSQALAGRITPEKTELGYNCTASGHHSTAIGDGSTASGYFSTAIGDHSTASGKYSTAIGTNTTALGEYSTAMGAFTRAYSAFETVIGCNMTEYTPVSTTVWYPTDRLFVIGNGPGTRSDAMVVLKNGNVGIGTSIPGAKLEVSGGSVSIGNAGEGNVLLYLSIERHWQLRQLGTGAYTALELASVGGGGNKNFVISTAGNVGIGTTDPSYKLHVNGSVAGTSWNNISSRDFKEDIQKVSEADHPMMLTKLMEMDLTTYKYKEMYGGDGTTKLGFIAEDMPEEVLSKDGKGVDVYELLTLTIGAMKAQQKKIEELEILNAKLAEVMQRLEVLEK